MTNLRRDVTISESSSETFYSADTDEETYSNETSPETVSETPLTDQSQAGTITTPTRRYPMRERRPPIRYQS